MDERYLIDSSAVIKYLNETFPDEGIHFIDKILDDECVISFVSEIELQVWNPPNSEDVVIYSTFVSRSTVLGISSTLINEAIRIRKVYALKLPDALIAATAFTHDRTLIADNDKDFTKVPELKYVNPKRLTEKKL